MDFRLLGPVEVASNGNRLALRGRKQRALLAMLLVRANDVVSREELIDGLWGENPPPTAQATVNVYLSRLRKQLAGTGADLLTRPHGYSLQADAESIDVRRFEASLDQGRRALAAGDATSAARALREGLSLWRGRPLADLDGEPFVERERAYLEERRLRALEDRIAADLGLGRHEEVLTELEALVRENPFRERFTAQLMLALYRSGRQAEALGAYRAGRKRLADELALEPGSELRELERAILAHDPELAPPSTRRKARRPSADRATRVPRPRWVAGLALAAAAAVVAFVSLTGDATVTVGPRSVAVIDARTTELVAAIPLATTSQAIASGRGSAWLSQRHAVAAIDPGTRNVVDAIGVPADVTPDDLAVNRDAIFVADAFGRVARIDPDSGEAVWRRRYAALGGDASGSLCSWGAAGPEVGPLGKYHAAVTTARGSVFYICAASILERIDRSTGRATEVELPGGNTLAVAVGLGAAWVVNHQTDSVTRIDLATNEPTDTIDVPRAPSAVAVGFGHVWVASFARDSVTQLDVSGGGLRIRSQREYDVGRRPVDIAIGAGAVWVASRDGTVSRIDPETGTVDRIAVGRPLRGIAIAAGSIWAITA